ncbi:MAG TPA: ABC transporter permease [Polyangiaceae bacterium]|nr:ABC transporter permease [Polyangiaceae bacterium]
MNMDAIATPRRRDRRHSASVDGSLGVAGDFLQQTAAIVEIEVRKLARDPSEVLTRSVQPILWLLVFGQVFTRTHAIPTGKITYLEFMTPGVLAQSVLFTAIFYGIAIIWERDLGVLHKMLVSPAYRGALVFGKALSAGFRGVAQAIIVYAVAYLLGVGLRIELMPVVGVLFAIMLGAAVFSTFSLIIACLVKTRERFMGIGQIMTMPLFFASNAIYPLEMMPGWLKTVARANPLTYLVDLLRTLMLQGGHTTFGLTADVGVETLVLVVLVFIAAKLYPTVAR